MACAKANYPTATSPQNNTVANQNRCALSFLAASFCLATTWDKQPAVNSQSSFIIRITKVADAQTLTDLPGTLTVVLWMPAMGHGSSPATIEKMDTGIYHVTNAYFIMPGEWEVRFQLLNDQSQVIDKAVQKIAIQ
jgi:hypothetical protein